MIFQMFIHIKYNFALNFLKKIFLKKNKKFVFNKMKSTIQKYNLYLGGFLILVGIVLGVVGVIPYKQALNESCGDSDTTCFINGGVCDLETKKCIITKKRYHLLIPAIFLVIAGIFIIYYFNYADKR